MWRIPWEGFEPQHIRGLDEFLLARLVRTQERAVVGSDDRDAAPLLRCLESMVREKPGEHWTLKQAASRLGTSSRSQQRWLAEDGTTFRTKVRRSRLAIAFELIGATERSLTDIAHAAGFPTLKQFGRSFRAEFGCAPSSLRAKD